MTQEEILKKQIVDGVPLRILSRFCELLKVEPPTSDSRVEAYNALDRLLDANDLKTSVAYDSGYEDGHSEGYKEGYKDGEEEKSGEEL